MVQGYKYRLLCFRHTQAHTHQRTQVSMQVIERDRRAPECHTWAPGGQRRTEVGRTQPFKAQAFTMAINHQPGLALPCQGLPTHSLLCVQSADCAVWKLLCARCVCDCDCACVCVSVKKKYVCTSVSINPPVCVCACFVLYACTCFLHSGQNSWFQKEVIHCQQEHRLACLSVKNKAVCSLLELHAGLAAERKNVRCVLT